MARAEKIADHLPHFYMCWDETTAVSALVRSAGKSMDEAEKDFVGIMRAHWVDSAARDDLDGIGALYSMARKASESDDDYRGRLKTAVLSYKGGGTANAVRMMVRIALGLPADYPVAIEENPPVRMTKSWKALAGAEWTVNPRNVREAAPRITLEVETENVRITDPAITNRDTGEVVGYRGDLKKGDRLVIEGSRATLNGKDVSERLTGKAPVLPRRKTKWQYTESIGANLGVFDQALFDRAVFSVDISSTITLEWTANQPAAFDVILEKGLVERAGVTEAYLQEIVNMAKGCGVKAGVRLTEGKKTEPQVVG